MQTGIARESARQRRRSSATARIVGEQHGMAFDDPREGHGAHRLAVVMGVDGDVGQAGQAFRGARGRHGIALGDAREHAGDGGVGHQTLKTSRASATWPVMAAATYHDRAHQHGAAGLGTLAALEVAVRGAGAELVADELVGIHREAHGATGAAPFEAGLGEDLVEALVDGLDGGELRAGDDDRLHGRADLAALEVLGRLAQVGDAAVGAGTEEADIYLWCP